MLECNPEVLTSSSQTIGDDGFSGTPLAEVLRAQSVQHMAMGGLLSEMCVVAATARSALAGGLLRESSVLLGAGPHAVAGRPPGLPATSAPVSDFLLIPDVARSGLPALAARPEACKGALSTWGRGPCVPGVRRGFGRW